MRPRQTIPQILEGFGLTLEAVKAACEPTLSDHRLIFQPATNNWGDFFAYVFYLATDPDVRQEPNEGWVASFILEIEQLHMTIPPSPRNRMGCIDEWVICGNSPYPKFFEPIIDNIQTLLAPSHLSIRDVHIPFGTGDDHDFE